MGVPLAGWRMKGSEPMATGLDYHRGCHLNKEALEIAEHTLLMISQGNHAGDEAKAAGRALAQVWDLLDRSPRT